MYIGGSRQVYVRQTCTYHVPNIYLNIYLTQHSWRLGPLCNRADCLAWSVRSQTPSSPVRYEFRGLQIFASKRHDKLQIVQKMRVLNKKRYMLRYMIGTCSNIIYPISNPDVQRLCGELRYMLTIH